MNNANRAGFFTSSQMSRLCSSTKTGKKTSAYMTYVHEVVAEKSMGRVVGTEVKTKPMKWGSLMEVVLFNLLGIGYEMTHKKTIKHYKFETIWSGTPDLIAPKKIGEIKCFQPKNFALLSLCLMKKDIQKFKDEFPKEYWQCVSNAILCKVKRVEIIAYMPYKKELEEIIHQVNETSFLERNGLDPADYYFLTNDDIESHAYLPDDSKMSNINSFEFEVPVEDLMLLTQRVSEAEKEVHKIMSENAMVI